MIPAQGRQRGFSKQRDGTAQPDERMSAKPPGNQAGKQPGDPQAIRRRGEREEQARAAQGVDLEALLYDPSPGVLAAVLDNPRLNERHLTVLLARRDLPRETAAAIAQNKEWMKSYRLKAAAARHPRMPQHLAMAQLKYLYLFDLVGISTTAGVPAQVKRAAEDAILSQKEGIALGERTAMARRCSGRIAAALLGDADRRVVEVALGNPGLTGHAVAAAVVRESAFPHLAEAVERHQRWSVLREVRLALLRSRHLPLARLMGILGGLNRRDLADLAEDPRAPASLRSYVQRTLQAQRNPGTQSARKGL